MKLFTGVLLSLFSYFAQANPFHSVMQLNSNCSAVLVHPRLVITAAHCVTHSAYIVELDGKEYRTEKIMEHESYKEQDPHYDFALILLREPVEGAHLINAIPKIENSFDGRGGPVIAVGFGDRRSPSLSNDKHATQKLKIMPYEVEKYEPRGSLAVIKPTEKDVGLCRGDSGGGLFHQGKLLAINVQVQQGYKCSKNGIEAYSIFVSYFSDWIYKQTFIRL